MGAPLSDCAIEEQPAVVRFLWAEEVKLVEIYHGILAQNGAPSMNQRKVHDWVERFKEGRTRVTEESRSVAHQHHPQKNAV